MMRAFRMGLYVSFFTLCLDFMAAPHAKADVDNIRSSDSEIWGSVGGAFLNYKESVTPLPDSDHATIPSLAAGVSYMTNSNLYLSLDGSVAFGNGHYNGAYFFDPYLAATATTHETISNVDGKIGQGFAFTPGAMLIPYADLGFRYWGRSVGSDPAEDYETPDILGGLMVQASPIQQLVLTGYGALGTTFAADMKTSGTTYDLGSAGVYKLGGKIAYDLTPQVELFTTLDYDHFHFGHSPVVYNPSVASYSLEPGSVTSDTAIRVGLGYHFY